MTTLNSVGKAAQAVHEICINARAMDAVYENYYPNALYGPGDIPQYVAFLALRGMDPQRLFHAHPCCPAASGPKCRVWECTPRHPRPAAPDPVRRLHPACRPTPAS